ncbi:MAG: Ankyrin repeat domain-containing protein 44 [Trizodia sp. TS-e1964]|nr:MAG: Ankyrin repeat domain-containing protein 44 [Trizodia sp. TS-e1964]
MEDLIQYSDFERVIAPLFSRIRASLKPFSDSDFDDISRLLAQLGMEQWSVRPRTYAVLRLIDRTDLLDTFVQDGRKDIAFPYKPSQLPTLFSPVEIENFLRAQHLVLSNTSGLEKVDGRHRHLSEEPNAHFQSLRILGRGGSGAVDHVRSKLSLEEYARKRLRKTTFAKGSEALKTFENELRTLKRLSHHHLVRIIGSYTDPKHVALLISPVAQMDLKVFLTRNPFPQDDHLTLRGFFGCLNSALLYLHNSRIKHRDLKPQNILIFNNKILITDFGTAHDWSDESHSTTYGPVGPWTMNYAPPEVHDQGSRSSSSDIWSLGCVYLDMITVLRGETLDKKSTFFLENGTCGANPRSNPRALELWLSHLESEADLRPLSWIKMMIKPNRKERITAATLMEMIHAYEEGPAYYMTCCEEEDSDDQTSYKGSDDEEDISTSGIPKKLDNLEASANEQQSLLNKFSNININKVSNLARELEKETIFVKDFATSNKAARSQGLEENAGTLRGNTDSEIVFELDGTLLEPNYSKDLAHNHGFTVMQPWPKLNDRDLQSMLDSDFYISSCFNLVYGLRRAIRGGREGIAQALLATEARDSTTSSDGNEILHHALKYNNKTSVILMLLEENIDLESENSNGLTPLQVVSKRGDKALVRLFLAKGANILAKSRRQDTALHKAAEYGHAGVVLLLLENGADAAATNIDGHTVLHIATHFGHEKVLQLLMPLKTSLDINAKNRAGDTPLQMAIYNGQEAIVLLLLENEADVESINSEGETALHLAALKGQTSVVEMLLDHGAGLDSTKPDGSTALHNAAFGGHKPVVELLLKKGVNTNQKDLIGKTAIDRAAENNKEEVVQMLLLGTRMAALPNNQLSTLALLKAAKDGHKSSVSLLIKSGADLRAKDLLDDTVLHRVSRDGNAAIVQILLAEKADVTAINSRGYTPLHLAALAGHASVVKLLLLDNRTDIMAIDSNQSTALHLAASNGHMAIVQLLIEKGAKIAAMDINRYTALHIAAVGGHFEVSRLLLKSGMQTETSSLHGNTPLHKAAKHGHETVVRLLLEFGADIEAKNTIESTPLHEAAAEGHVAVVRQLVEMEANIEARDSLGNTAKDIAASRGHVLVAERLHWEQEKHLKFQEVISTGNVPDVNHLLSNGARLEARGLKGQTAMHNAARNGHEIVALLLLDRGANIEARDSDGFTPLHHAALNGHDAVIRLLLDYKPEMAVKTKNGNTCLHLATLGGHEVVAELLLEKSADIEAYNLTGATALHLAAYHGYGKIVRLLLNKGANIKARDLNGKTAICMAVREGHMEVSEQLRKQESRLQANDKILPRNEFEFERAIFKGDEAAVQNFLEKGVNLEARSSKGYTAMHTAVFQGHREIARLLVKAGANIEAQSENNDTPLHLAVQGLLPYSLATLLLDCGADVAAKNLSGLTALHYVAMSFEERSLFGNLVEDLKAAGANIDERDIYGNTPLMVAAGRSNISITLHLLNCGASLWAKNHDGHTALHLATVHGNFEMMQLFLVNGANTEATDLAGDTALMIAAKGGHNRRVKLILARETSTDANILQAIEMATSNGHKTTVKLLSENLKEKPKFKISSVFKR